MKPVMQAVLGVVLSTLTCGAAQGRAPDPPNTLTDEEMRNRVAISMAIGKSSIGDGERYIRGREQRFRSVYECAYDSIGSEIESAAIEQSPTLLRALGYIHNDGYQKGMNECDAFYRRHQDAFRADMVGVISSPDKDAPKRPARDLAMFREYEPKLEAAARECLPLFKQKLPIIQEITDLERKAKILTRWGEHGAEELQQAEALRAKLAPIDQQIAERAATLSALASRTLFGPNATAPLPGEDKSSAADADKAGKKDGDRARMVAVRFLTKGPDGWRAGAGKDLITGVATIAEVEFDRDPGEQVSPLTLAVGGRSLELPLKPAPDPDPSTGERRAGRKFRSEEFMVWPASNGGEGLAPPPPTR